jgi:23S rRNA (guanosine2251-2'-O)-methyltransferase
MSGLEGDAIISAMTDKIEGRQPVLEALRAGRGINKILLSSDSEKHGVVFEITRLARERGIPFEYVEKKILDRNASTPVHQGVLAYASAMRVFQPAGSAGNFAHKK